MNCKKLEQVYNSIPNEFPLKLIAEQYELKPKGSTRLVPHLKSQDKSTSGLEHHSVASVSLRSKLVSHFNAFGLSQLNFVNASGCFAYTFYGRPIYAQPSIAGPIPASSRYTVNQVLPLALVARLAQCVLWGIACLVSFKVLLF